MAHENPTEYSKRVTENSRAGGAEVTFPIVFFERLSRFFLLSRRELLVLALLFVVSLPAVTARLYSSDEVQYFSYLRSLYFDRDVSFENEYRYFYDRNIAQSGGFRETFLERETATGRRVNYGTLGAPLLWSPFYAVADAWTRATGSHEANGFTQPYVRAVAYGSAFYGFLAILLSIRAARLIVGPAGGLGAGLAVWVGTPLLFYMYVAPPFAHACSAFAVALFVNVWLHVRETWSARGAFALGLCAALMAMVREQDVFLALGPALDFLRTSWLAGTSQRGAPRALINAGLAGVTATLVGYVPQLLAYNALNGYPGPASDVARKMYWYSPHGLQVLASPEHGLFFWTPLAVLALVGLFFVRDRVVAACLAIMVAAQVYVSGSVDSWSVAGAFGHRRFVCITIILVIGLAALLAAARARPNGRAEMPPDARPEGRAAMPPDARPKGRAEMPPDARPKGRAYLLLALTIVMVWWNVALMAQFATRLMDRQRLEPARNAYHAFVTLPRSAPSLLHRYLTDRASFYESRPKQDVP